MPQQYEPPSHLKEEPTNSINQVLIIAT